MGNLNLVQYNELRNKRMKLWVTCCDLNGFKFVNFQIRCAK